MCEKELSIPDPTVLRVMVEGYKACRILLTAVELKLFDAVGEGGSTSLEVAVGIGTDPRATDRLMNALVSLALLRKESGRFLHSDLSETYLRSASPRYMASLMHAVHLWDSWSTLTEAVRQGRPVEERFRRREKPERTESFIAAMHHFAQTRAESVLRVLDLSGVRRILDVGGGSGAYTIAFVQAIGEAASGTVFDLPGVLPLTRRYIAEAGLERRVETLAGDFLEDPFPGGYDLVFLSAIVHINSDAENRALVRKAAEALNPGGRVVVRDFFVAEDRSGPPRATLFALNMLVNTESGDTYTESEMRAWFEAAGLTDVVRLEDEPASGLLVGRRKAVAGKP